MIYNKVKEYRNIDSLLLFKDMQILKKNKELTFINSSEILNKITFEEKIFSLKIDDGRLLYSYENGVSELIDLKTLKKIVDKAHSIKIEDTNGDVAIFYENDSIFHPVSWGLISNCSNVIWRKELKGRLGFIDDRLMHFKDTMLTLLDTKNANLLWEFDLSTIKTKNTNEIATQPAEFRIARVYGINQDILWLFINCGTILGINLINGKTAYQFDIDDYPLGGLNYKIDQGRNLLIAMQDKREKETYYSQLDLRNPLSGFQNKEINAHYNGETYAAYARDGLIIDRNLIYSFDADLGVFIYDRDTDKIVWAQKIEIEKDFFSKIREIQKNEKQLFVLDRNNTLHVFMKRQALNPEI